MPLKSGLQKTRSVDEGKRALGDGRAHSDEENIVGEQWPRKVSRLEILARHKSYCEFLERVKVTRQ